MREPEDFNPHDVMTRGEFVGELADIWEAIVADLTKANRRAMHPRPEVQKRLIEIETAIKVLKNTFFAEELVDLKQYEQQLREEPASN